MNWDQIQASWKQLKQKFVFQGFKTTGDGNTVELIVAEMSRDGESDEQPRVFHPDDRGKRSEFSLHIGC